MSAGCLVGKSLVLEAFETLETAFRACENNMFARSALRTLASVLLAEPRAIALEDCLKGDRRCLERLVRYATPIFRRRIRKVLRARKARTIPDEVVEDIVQAAFEALFKHGGRALAAYDPKRGMSLEGYLGQIAAREAGNHLDRMWAAKRGGVAGEVVSDPTDGPIARAAIAGHDPETLTQGHETARRLEQALLERLTDQGRFYFRMLYVEALSVQEICRVASVSPDVVYSWRKRIRAAFRQVLAQDEDG